MWGGPGKGTRCRDCDFVECDAEPLSRRSSRPFVAFVEQVLLLETSISLRCFAEHHRPA